jgi:hypothetical protein
MISTRSFCQTPTQLISVDEDVLAVWDDDGDDSRVGGTEINPDGTAVQILSRHF